MYQLRINEPPVLKLNSVKIVANVISRNDSIVIGQTLVYIEKDDRSDALTYGDVLLVKAFKAIRELLGVIATVSLLLTCWISEV